MPEINYIKLSDLTRQIADHIKLSFGQQYYWIVAEISGHKFYPNQDRHYFDFVEKIEGQNAETAKVKGIAWSGGAQSIHSFEEVTAQKFSNGIQILALVRVEFHAIHGFSLILTEIDPSFTLGNLERQRRETLLKLVASNPGVISIVGEEFLTRNKGLTLPAVMQKIALIASQNSEGYNDFVHTMKANQYGYKFHVDEYRSSVQGALAENELVDTLIKIYNSGIPYDCVVIVRGGGAKTDFLVFDTYRVALAVARFPIPVITGIGHHKDVSITDLMAHTVTKTPTKSAEFIISHARSFEEGMMQLQKNSIIRAQQLLSNAWQRIHALNFLAIDTSRTLLEQHKTGLVQAHQSVIHATRSLFYTSKTNLSDVQQTILNRSATTLFVNRSRFSTLVAKISDRPLVVKATRQASLMNVSGAVQLHSIKYLTGQRKAVEHYNTLITIMTPDNLLKKGFAWISQKGRILKDAREVEIGSELTINMHHTEVLTSVVSKKEKVYEK